jgi:hypothetical protein
MRNSSRHLAARTLSQANSGVPQASNTLLTSPRGSFLDPPLVWKELFHPYPHEELKSSLLLTQATWHDSFPPSRASVTTTKPSRKGMLIKVQEATFRLCKGLSPKLHDYSTWTGSWFPALAATTNQPFGMHFGHVHVPASSPCLPPLLGPRFLLAPKWSPILIWAYTREFHLPMPFDNLFFFFFLVCLRCNIYLCDAISCLWCNLLEAQKLSLYFTYNLMWYICVPFRPLKERWCPHHGLYFFCFFKLCDHGHFLTCITRGLPNPSRGHN